MLPSRKIFMGITGASLIALGVLCISRPAETILSIAWVLGLITLISGICTFLNWANLRRFIPQSGTLFLSSIMQILFGIMFMQPDLRIAGVLPLLFAIFLLFEGINLAIRSFDYKKIGFKYWWINFVLGVAAAVLGFASVCTPHIGHATLSAVIGVGFIIIGVVYIIALTAVNRFEKRLNSNPWID